MAWFNNGTDLESLAGSTSRTFAMLPLGAIPDGYSAGMTILRMIGVITYAASVATDLVNAVSAIYVARRGTTGLPPNLNADLLDYYYYRGLQAPISGGAPGREALFDIRSKRKLRGDRELIFRVTNNEVTSMQVGLEIRFLMQQS